MEDNDREPVYLEPINVIKVIQPIGEYFMASVPAKTIVDISYSDLRRLEGSDRDVELYFGIQRPLLKKRVAEIRSYIEMPDATFPTGIILAIDERCSEYDETTGQLHLHEYIDEFDASKNVELHQIGNILDGQHRIAGFTDDEGEFLDQFDGDNFDLNVIMMIGADLPEQANVFAIVNLAQTRVNKSLAYDLSELARKPTPFKTCHNVAVALDQTAESPFYHRIKRLGVATKGRKNEPLTQAAFVEALLPFITTDPFEDQLHQVRGKRLKRVSGEKLVETPLRNMFIRRDETDIAEVIFNYFKAIKNKWPRAWSAIDQTGNLLPRTNAFKAFMKFLKEDIYPELADGRDDYIPKMKELAPHLNNIDLSDEEFTTRTFVPGSTGQKTFLQLLRGEVAAADILEDD